MEEAVILLEAMLLAVILHRQLLHQQRRQMQQQLQRLKKRQKRDRPLLFMTIDFNAGTSNTGDYAEEIKQKVEDATGVNLEIEWVLSDVTDEKITLAMANPSTMPMIITHSGSLTGNIVKCSQGRCFRRPE